MSDERISLVDQDGLPLQSRSSSNQPQSNSSSPSLHHQLSLPMIVLLLIILTSIVNCQYSWQVRDEFDNIQSAIESIDQTNCKVVDVNRLFLKHNAVTHVPDLQWIGINPVFPNRTNLLQVHNMALSRAFFLR